MSVEVQEAVDRVGFQFTGTENDSDAFGKGALYVGQHLGIQAELEDEGRFRGAGKLRVPGLVKGGTAW